MNTLPNIDLDNYWVNRELEAREELESGYCDCGYKLDEQGRCWMCWMEEVKGD